MITLIEFILFNYNLKSNILKVYIILNKSGFLVL